MSGDPQPKVFRQRSKPPTDFSAPTRVAVTWRSNGLCEAMTPVCHQGPHRGVHMHHVEARRAGDHTAANALNVCHAAHAHIHAHPAEAFERGWMRPVNSVLL
jgi:homoserine acetyltransferase